MAVRSKALIDAAVDVDRPHQEPSSPAGLLGHLGEDVAGDGRLEPAAQGLGGVEGVAEQDQEAKALLEDVVVSGDLQVGIPQGVVVAGPEEGVEHALLEHVAREGSADK
jgi:hypothetical protein